MSNRLDWEKERARRLRQATGSERVGMDRERMTVAQAARLERELDANPAAAAQLRAYFREHGVAMEMGRLTAGSILTWLIDRNGESDSFPLLPP